MQSNSIQLSFGQTLPAVGWDAFRAACRDGNGRYDVKYAAPAVIGLYQEIGSELIFRASGATDGEWYYWDKAWQHYDAILFSKDLSHLLAGLGDSDRELSALINTLARKLARPWNEFDGQSCLAIPRHTIRLTGGTMEITKGQDKKDYCTYFLPQSPSKIDTPLFTGILDRALPDPEDQCTMQEIFGVCLLPTIVKAFYIFTGESNTGKSLFARILRHIIPGQTTGLQIHSLQFEHTTSGLLNSWLNVDGECEIVPHASEILFKSLIGGDPISINRKHGALFSVVLNTKMLMLCNTLPKFRDKSNAIWNRMVIVPFSHPVPTALQIPINVLLDRLTPEIPGILMWALLGAKRILSKGSEGGAFTQSIRAAGIKDAHHRDCNLVEVWWDECIRLDPNGKITKDSAYKHFRNWALDHGHRDDKLLTAETFAKSVRKLLERAAEPAAKIELKPHAGPRQWLGIALVA
jgi:P4 family phage/plasmid primase-like protien